MTSVEYEILLRDKFSQPISKINTKLDKFNTKITETNAKSKRLKTGIGGSLGSIVKGFGIAGIVMGLGKLGKSIVGLGADMEQTKVSFSVMLGSMDKANKMVNDINKFANATPFQNDELFNTTKMLLNYGVTQKQMMPIMKQLGDVSGGSAERLNRLALAYGQVHSLGRLQGQDMKQMIEVGFNPLQEMARTTGKSMGELSEMMRKGQIPIKMVDEAFASATAEGGKFHNMMQKQSKTLAGRWSTFMGKLKMVGITIGTKLLPILGKGVDYLTAFMESSVKNFHYIQDALKPLMDAYKGLFKSIKKLFIALFKSNKTALKTSDVWKKIGKILKLVTFPTRIMIRMLAWIIDKGADIVTWLKRMYDKFAGFRKVINALLLPFKKLIQAFEWAERKLKGDNRIRDNKSAYEKLSNYAAKYKRLIELRKKGVKLSEKELNFIKLFEKVNKNNKIFKRLAKLKAKQKAEGEGDSPATDPFLNPIKNLGGNGRAGGKDAYKITGSAPKIFNLNVTKLVENLNVTTNTIKEGANQVQDMVLEALQKALVDVQTSVR